MTYLLQVAIPYFTRLPNDVVVNTFHFDWAGGGAPTLTNFNTLLSDINAFYSTIFPATGGNLINGSLVVTATSFKLFNLTDPEPRVPTFSTTATLGAQTDPLYSTPLEVALCLSYYATPISGVNQASRRGRLYIGPFGDLLSISGSPTAFTAPSTATITAFTTAAHNLKTSTTADSWIWVVYSRKLNSSAAIVGGWVDNAWDTQRRRGNAPTVRSLWT